MSASDRFLVIVPAHNEADCLPAVVAEMRATMPGVSLLVVDDGSVDDTPAVLAAHGVDSLRLLQRVGLGTAVRAGLCRAASLGYETVVRIDGDGQHDARDITAIAGPVLRGEADVVIGTRYATHRSGAAGALRGVAKRGLAFVLSAITGRPVTDATSGFCAFGPRALRLLTAHHPRGYPEVELRLLLHRHGLTVCEVPIQQRPRFAGRTTLTPGRMVVAAARIALAIALTPLRGIVPSEHP
jgi:glycosyltransferase involved in cell wall biosynthesis